MCAIHLWNFTGITAKSVARAFICPISRGILIFMRVDAVFILFIVSLIVLAGTHHLAMAFSLYWVYPWFDTPMHLFGGITVALGLHTPLFARILRVRPHSYFATLMIVMGVGVAWEVYEWLIKIVDSIAYVPDTILDLILDAVGASIGFLIARYANYDS
jgi:hypothetical protein